MSEGIAGIVQVPRVARHGVGALPEARCHHDARERLGRRRLPLLPRAAEVLAWDELGHQSDVDALAAELSSHRGVRYCNHITSDLDHPTSRCTMQVARPTK